MPFRFRHIRTQLTLKYAGVVALLLLLLGGVNLAYQYQYLRQQIDMNLREDLEIVEDILLTNQTVVNPLNVISDHQPQPYERLVEIWSDSGTLLYHSSAFRFLSPPPPPRADRYSEVPAYFSLEFPDGGQWRTIGVLVSTPHQRRIVRISMSEEHLRSQILEMLEFLGILSPLLLLAAVATGSILARQALRPIDLMVSQVRSFGVTTLNQRLHIPTPDDELGHLAAVINDLLSRLQDAFEKLKRFTADASHELRTPLTTMRSVGEIGLQPGRPPERYREVIGSMLEENERLTSLIDSLLFLSKADADAIRLSPDQFDLADLVKESREIISILADEKGQSIMVRTPTTLPVTADKTLLRRALLNLVDNAIKYSPAGGDIEITAERAPGLMVRIRIRDSGPGIPFEYHSVVFDRFFRIEDSRSREAGGTGLGLSIVHWVVNAHGGRVWIESPGSGTDVVLELPISRDSGLDQDPARSAPTRQT